MQSSTVSTAKCTVAPTERNCNTLVPSTVCTLVNALLIARDKCCAQGRPVARGRQFVAPRFFSPLFRVHPSPRHPAIKSTNSTFFPIFCPQNVALSSRATARITIPERISSKPLEKSGTYRELYAISHS